MSTSDKKSGELVNNGYQPTSKQQFKDGYQPSATAQSQTKPVAPPPKNP